MTQPVSPVLRPPWLRSFLIGQGFDAVPSSPPPDNGLATTDQTRETPAIGLPIVSTHYYKTFPMGNNPQQSILLSVKEAIHLAFMDQEVYPEEIRLHPLVQGLLAAETGDGTRLYLPGDRPCFVRSLETLSVAEVRCLFRITATHAPLEGR